MLLSCLGNIILKVLTDTCRLSAYSILLCGLCSAENWFSSVYWVFYMYGVLQKLYFDWAVMFILRVFDRRCPKWLGLWMA